MELKASDVVQTLEEMAVLTHELLTSDPSCDDTTAVAVFAKALASKLPRSIPGSTIESNYRVPATGKDAQTRNARGSLRLAKCLTFAILNTRVMTIMTKLCPSWMKRLLPIFPEMNSWPNVKKLRHG
jgi:hypothetical protein